METTKIEKDTGLLKIELNSKGDYIVISADNSMLFDNFTAGVKNIADMADEIAEKLNEIEKRYGAKADFESVMQKTSEVSKINVRFSKDAIAVVDGIFGEGTVRKYFREAYEEIPNFLPDADCIIDFFEQLTPEMEKLFNRKAEERSKKSKERMAKYQPQNHRKPGSK